MRPEMEKLTLLKPFKNSRHFLPWWYRTNGTSGFGDKNCWNSFLRSKKISGNCYSVLHSKRKVFYVFKFLWGNIHTYIHISLSRCQKAKPEEYMGFKYSDHTLKYWNTSMYKGFSRADGNFKFLYYTYQTLSRFKIFLL